jgi:hypothetical protein
LNSTSSLLPDLLNTTKSQHNLIQKVNKGAFVKQRHNWLPEKLIKDKQKEYFFTEQS